VRTPTRARVRKARRGNAPVAGDIAGLGADAYDWWMHPETRTRGNALLTATSALPFVPRWLGRLKDLGDYTRAYVQEDVILPLNQAATRNARGRRANCERRGDKPRSSAKHPYDGTPVDDPVGLALRWHGARRADATPIRRAPRDRGRGGTPI
jgi:hypothetical protein